MAWRQTEWSFVTSRGVEITSGPDVVTIGNTAGSLYLKNKRTQRQVELDYGAWGIGVGVGIPWSISTSTRDMPCGGIGAILGNDCYRLHPEDFSGLCIIGNLQYGNTYDGKNVSAIYFNIPVLPMLLGTTGLGIGLDAMVGALSLGTAPGLLSTAKAMTLIWGTSVGIEAGAGAMYYYGYLG